MVGRTVTNPQLWPPTQEIISYQGIYTRVPYALCPDLLRYDQIGAADNLRGRFVRGFFWLMRVWPT